MTYAVQFKRKDGSTGLVLKSEDSDNEISVEYFDTVIDAEQLVDEMNANWGCTGLEYSVVNINGCGKEFV
jgi:hypothetical protein